jgi:hypothetical protein
MFSASDTAKFLFETFKHLKNITPKNCLAILILTFLFFAVIFVFKTNFINFLKPNMFDVSFNTKQNTAHRFNTAVELHMNVAIKKIANILKGRGNFICEYLIWDEKGTNENPSLNPKLMFVRSFNSKKNIVEDARYRLKNNGEQDPNYSPEVNLFLYNGTGIKADRKTVEDYASAGVAVDNMFINESIVNNTTFYGNFDFKVDTIFGATILNKTGKRIGRFVCLVDEEDTESLDNFNNKEDTGLLIVEELADSVIKATWDGE